MSPLFFDCKIMDNSQVFEKLGPSLFDFIKTNEYRPFSIDLVREFGRQLLGSVACVFFTLKTMYLNSFVVSAICDLNNVLHAFGIIFCYFCRPTWLELNTYRFET